MATTADRSNVDFAERLGRMRSMVGEQGKRQVEKWRVIERR